MNRLQPDIAPAYPEMGDYQAHEQVRSRWLILVAIVGALMVAGSILWNVVWDRQDLLPSVLLELGAGSLLFSLLFGVERASVRKVVQLETGRLYQALRPMGGREDADEKRIAASMDQSVRELGLAPFQAAHAWYAAAYAGDYAHLWDLSDSNWRLCRAQAWVWNNRVLDGVALSEEQCEQLSYELAAGPGVSDYWDAFAAIEGDAFRESYSASPDELGSASKRRVLAPGYELVHMIPLGDNVDGMRVKREVLIHSGVNFLFGWDGDRWLLASHISLAPPTPGLPPSWWYFDSVPDDAMHFALPPEIAEQQAQESLERDD